MGFDRKQSFLPYLIRLVPLVKFMAPGDVLFFVFFGQNWLRSYFSWAGWVLQRGNTNAKFYCESVRFYSSEA